MSPAHDAAAPKSTVVTRMLDAIERVGNRLPDPAVLFLLLMLAVWAVSALLSGVQFSEIDPRTVSAENPGGTPIQVVNLLSGTSLTGCECTQQGAPKTETDQGTYTAENGTLTMTGSDDVPETNELCVTGDSLKVKHVDEEEDGGTPTTIVWAAARQ